MSTINIKQLIGNLTIVTTPKNLQSDLEDKNSTAIIKALKSVQGQETEMVQKVNAELLKVINSSKLNP